MTADHLGSGNILLNSAGTSLVKESYSAYGYRRAGNWSGPLSTGSADYNTIATTTRRGYTGGFHEMLDNVGLIHMNGRVYDPVVGRFLSADLVVAQVGNSQSGNPYSYVDNRPLTLTDPSGYFRSAPPRYHGNAWNVLGATDPDLFSGIAGDAEVAASTGFYGADRPDGAVADGMGGKLPIGFFSIGHSLQAAMAGFSTIEPSNWAGWPAALGQASTPQQNASVTVGCVAGDSGCSWGNGESQASHDSGYTTTEFFSRLEAAAQATDAFFAWLTGFGPSGSALFGYAGSRLTGPLSDVATGLVVASSGVQVLKQIGELNPIGAAQTASRSIIIFGAGLGGAALGARCGEAALVCSPVLFAVSAFGASQGYIQDPVAGAIRAAGIQAGNAYGDFETRMRWLLFPITRGLDLLPVGYH